MLETHYRENYNRDTRTAYDAQQIRRFASADLEGIIYDWDAKFPSLVDSGLVEERRFLRQDAGERDTLQPPKLPVAPPTRWERFCLFVANKFPKRKSKVLTLAK
jgi:hypothetical protein